MTNAPKDKHEENIPVEDEALALFERGQELIHYCSNLLDQTELKVQQILGEEIVDFETQVE
jgi:exodeoxyribonuclease VII small subunit